MSSAADKFKFHSENAFDYRYRTGDVGDVMKRYGIERTRSVHPDGRSGKPRRTASQVDREIAAAMKNDYDTRRTMEAAALAGNKDAKKYAKGGFNPDNIFEAHETMQGLKKKYGADNDYGLTYAAVKDDRKTLREKVDKRINKKVDKKFEAMSVEDQMKNAKSFSEPSSEIQEAKERVAAYQSNRGGLFN